MVNTTFAQPLVVTLTENFANSPLPGAKIDFAPTTRTILSPSAPAGHLHHPRIDGR